MQIDMTIRRHNPRTTRSEITALFLKCLLRLIVCGVLLGGGSVTDAFGQRGEEEYQRKMDELRRRGKQQSGQTGEDRAQPHAPSGADRAPVPGRLLNISATPGACQQQQYDRFRDATSFDMVVGTIYKTDGKPAPPTKRAGGRRVPAEELRLALAATSSGKQLGVTPPPQVDWYFLSIAPNYRYYDEAEVLMIIDGERVKIGNAYSLGGSAIFSDVEERLRIRVPANLFLRIANAREIEVQIGANEFRLEEAALKAMREFASCAQIK